ncbi:hypothetical protein L5515_013629 [Caenorhabditis briggsae]|uniref:Uncharacterized protein n=1 Tax=Caenorhabditis briggsae TaxID=6238 RepID=A0AAE9J6F1_CAEBR|nr:hypothetical protein L5515_013629 [Caenorhabditis briggsae]
MIPTGSEILLKTLQFFLFIVIFPFFDCCARTRKKKKPSAEPLKRTPPTSKSRTGSQKEQENNKKTEKTEKMDKTEKEVSDIQFDIKMKKKVSKYDEFDDDEENPLAKLPVVSRPKKCHPKPSVSASPQPFTPTNATNKPKTTISTTEKLGNRMESERPLFPTDTANGSSCYVNLR